MSGRTVAVNFPVLSVLAPIRDGTSFPCTYLMLCRLTTNRW
jgi:hypothetical protein